MKQSQISPQAPVTASTHPPHAILTTEQVAAWLQVHPRQLSRLGVPRWKMGHKTIRYRAKDVQAWIDRQAKQGNRP